MTHAAALALDPVAFAGQFARAAQKQGFQSEPLVQIGDVPLAAYTKRTPGVIPRVYVSSGVHGDEPAGPLALLRLLETGVFDRRATWFLCPLLNPAGFLRRTRENFEGIDLNRDYKDIKTIEIAAHVRWLRRQPRFDVGFCLHEDWESAGFYLYELNPAGRPSLAGEMIEAASRCGPIETAGLIDGRPSTGPGLIRPEIDAFIRENWPEALYLRTNHTDLTYTIESASSQPIEQRVATHVAVMTAALDALFSS